jgi:hypothetical protein
MAVKLSINFSKNKFPSSLPKWGLSPKVSRFKSILKTTNKSADQARRHSNSGEHKVPAMVLGES